jgi:hypothetical protein
MNYVFLQYAYKYPKKARYGTVYYRKDREQANSGNEVLVNLKKINLDKYYIV